MAPRKRPAAGSQIVFAPAKKNSRSFSASELLANDNTDADVVSVASSADRQKAREISATGACLGTCLFEHCSFHMTTCVCRLVDFPYIKLLQV